MKQFDVVVIGAGLAGVAAAIYAVQAGAQVKLISSGKWDPDTLEDLSAVMADSSICGLGQAAPNPLRSTLKFFAEDLK